MVGERRAQLLVVAAAAVAGDIRADADQLGTAHVEDDTRSSLRVLGALPPVTYTQSRFWRYQLAEAAARLAEDTLRWGAPLPRCTGEEMVLHLILRRASAGDPDRSGWDELDEVLFQDHDVLMLYDMPAKVIDGQFRGVNLEPERWFSEFTLPHPAPERQ